MLTWQTCLPETSYGHLPLVANFQRLIDRHDVDFPISDSRKPTRGAITQIDRCCGTSDAGVQLSITRKPEYP